MLLSACIKLLSLPLLVNTSPTHRSITESNANNNAPNCGPISPPHVLICSEPNYTGVCNDIATIAFNCINLLPRHFEIDSMTTSFGTFCYLYE